MTGEQAEVDHIVPVSKAPRFENWIGNLGVHASHAESAEVEQDG